MIEATKPFLSFDFSLAALVSDPTGSGTSSFLDALTVSLDNVTSTFSLLLVDQNGALPDPWYRIRYGGPRCSIDVGLQLQLQRRCLVAGGADGQVLRGFHECG